MIAPVRVHHVVLTNTLLTTSSVSVSFSTSPADLSWTWTMTAITRTTMTGTVRRLRMAAHTPYCLSTCHGRLKEGAKEDSSSLLSPVVCPPSLPATQLSVILSLPTVLPVTTQQPGTHSSHSHTNAHTLRDIYFLHIVLQRIVQLRLSYLICLSYIRVKLKMLP